MRRSPENTVWPKLSTSCLCVILSGRVASSASLVAPNASYFPLCPLVSQCVPMTDTVNPPFLRKSSFVWVCVIDVGFKSNFSWAIRSDCWGTDKNSKHYVRCSSQHSVDIKSPLNPGFPLNTNTCGFHAQTRWTMELVRRGRNLGG